MLIQCFGSALNLNPHFHLLYLNGIYDANGYFWPVKPPTREDLEARWNSWDAWQRWSQTARQPYAVSWRVLAEQQATSICRSPDTY